MNNKTYIIWSTKPFDITDKIYFSLEDMEENEVISLGDKIYSASTKTGLISDIDCVVIYDIREDTEL